MAVTHVVVGMPVADYAAALTWYERLLGRPPDVIVTDNEAVWRVAEAGWVYVVRDPPRAGAALLTLLVDNLEEVAALAQRGLTAGPIDTVPGVVRKAVLIDPAGTGSPDPAGNRITVGKGLSPLD